MPINSKQAHGLAPFYVIATKNKNGQIVPLKLAPMSLAIAEKHAAKIRSLAPDATVYVINAKSVG